MKLLWKKNLNNSILELEEIDILDRKPFMPRMKNTEAQIGPVTYAKSHMN